MEAKVVELRKDIKDLEKLGESLRKTNEALLQQNQILEFSIQTLKKMHQIESEIDI